MGTEQAVTPSPAGVVAKLSVPTLTAMVVGAGVFSLPARFGVATGILGSLIAWAIAGTGMLMLGFVFQNLAIRKPELDRRRLDRTVDRPHCSLAQPGLRP
jgi:arginine:ornithine antiporter / lysine permease